MKQVVQNLRDGSISVPEVPDPVLRPGGILVQTVCSVLSPGTEGSRTALARESLLGKARRRPDLVRQVIQSVKRDGLRSTLTKVKDRLDTPKAPGYSLAGRVIAVANDVHEFNIGDKVACAGEGYASHAEIIFVPRNLAAKVPEGVAPETASFATLGSIALHGVRQLESRLGETVVVLGLGLIGQLAWQLLKASGIQAIGVDIAGAAVARARALGLDHAYLTTDPVNEIVHELTESLGADGVLITAGSSSNEPMVMAGALCRDRGRVVILGAVHADLPRSPYYEKELEVRMSRSYGPGRYDIQYEERGLDYPAGYVRWTERRNLAAFLDLCRRQSLHVGDLVGARFNLTQAQEAYTLLVSPAAPHGQAILLHPGEESPADWPEFKTPALNPVLERTAAPVRRASQDNTALSIGLIGAGNFARSTLLPHIRNYPGASLIGVGTAHPHTSRHVADQFGFQYAATDPIKIIEDPATTVIFIATHHDSHAELARRALEMGKSVFVEKPLALDEQSLEAVLDARRKSQGNLAVGFNRRFSPLVDTLAHALPAGVPRQMLLRVNAGPLPARHWLADPLLGGGRIVGEGCHFFDLAVCLAGSRAIQVTAQGDHQDFTALIKFENGSVASILYTGAGDTSLPKERYEVYAGGVAGVLDDFRKLHLHRNGRSRTHGSRQVQKGHVELITSFLDAVTSGGPDPIQLETVSHSHQLTFSAAAQLRQT